MTAQVRKYTANQLALLRDAEKVADIKEAMSEHESMFVLKPNVIAMGAGLRTHNNKIVDELVLKVYVARKVSPQHLSHDQICPSTVTVSGVTIPVDIEESRIPVAHAAFTARVRPVMGGASGGPVIPAGRAISANLLAALNRKLLAWFVDQLQIESLDDIWAFPGDSGALVLDAANNQPIGMHIAGWRDAMGINFVRYGIANRIDNVMQALGIVTI